MSNSNTVITPKMTAFAANLGLNLKLKSIDDAIQDLPEPETQMGVLMMAQALCFARIRRKHGITGKRRKLVLDKALADFEAKIREFGFEDKPQVPAKEAKPEETRPADCDGEHSVVLDALKEC